MMPGVSTPQKVGVAGILLLMLVGIGQCGSETEEDEPVERVETSRTTTPPSVVPEPIPTPTPRPAPAYQPGHDDDSGSVYYDNCSAARAAGAAPLHPGEPGYGRHLDRDGDGSACE